MPETTPLIKAALNLRVGAGFDVYILIFTYLEYHRVHAKICTHPIMGSNINQD